jgi:hypothetical protein
MIFIIVINLLMFPLLGHRPSLRVTHKENEPYPTTDWWVLTTANAAGTKR